MPDLEPARKKATQALARVPDPLLPALLRAHRFGKWRFWRRVRSGERFLAESERWSPERLEEYQLAQLRALLAHAHANVPYYRKVFGELGAHPGDFRQLADLARLPTLTKADLQEHLQDLTATNVPPGRRVYVTTAGSTGIPVGFYHDAEETEAKELAFLASQWGRVGYRLGDRVAVLRGAVVQEGALWERSPFRNALLLSSYHLTPDRLPLFLDRLRRFGPRFLQGYPSSLSLLADYMLEHGEPPIEGVRAVLCASENLYDWQREQLGQAFRCRIYSHYGQSEVVCLAGECEHDTRLHIFPQYGVTELVDENGLPIAEPGRVGEVVGTGFLTRSMPLIRYRTMDLASFAPGTCELCGRPYRLFERIEGRLQEFIVTGTGRQISMAAINMHSPVFDNVYQFRFYQERAGEVTLRVVPKRSYSEERDKDRMLRELRPKLGADVELAIETVPEIQRSGRGKYRFLEQRLATRFGDR